jgi:hypothetical protein
MRFIKNRKRRAFRMKQELRKAWKRALREDPIFLRLGKPIHFDRQGRPIGFLKWTVLFEQKKYRRVAMTTVGDWTVSTAWLGTPLSPSLIGNFESAVWRNGGDVDPVQRYATEAEAVAGHAELVKHAQVISKHAREWHGNEN